VKYITFLSREIWPSFNSIYAYTKIRGRYPKEIVIFYSTLDMALRLERMIKILYNKKDVKIRKIRIEEDIEDMKKMLENLIEDGDTIDITGARKSMILGLIDVRGVKIIYLLLKDMRFSSYPFMMRPLSLQMLMEVER